MEKWKNGKMEKKKNVKMKKWKNGKMEKWGNKKWKEWKNGKMEKMEKCKNVFVNVNLMSNKGSACTITEPEVHDKVLDNNPDGIGIWKYGFLRRGVNRRTRRKTSRSKEENQQQTQPTYYAGSGNQTRNTFVEGECSHHCAISSTYD